MDTGWGTPYYKWHPRGLFWDSSGGKVYLTNNSDFGCKIQRMNLDGTQLEDVLSGSFMGWINDVVLDSTGMIYWTDNSNCSIRRAALGGTAWEEVYPSPGENELCGLAIDLGANKLYWTEFTSNRILRANLDGTGCQVLLTGLNNPRHIELDVTHGKIYWTEFGSGRIYRANLDGMSVEQLVASKYEVGGVSLDVCGGWMYWRDNQGLLRSNLDGGNIQQLSNMGSDLYSSDVVVTPEPATVGLVAVGLSALVVRRRKARR
jgi:streptogramin lyase